MRMRVSFDLDDDDLKHFRLIMRAARHTVLRQTPEDVVAGAEAVLARLREEKVPPFVRDRLARLQVMIDMLTDHQWRLPQKDTIRVLNALAYFTDPEDLIPDHVPGIGYLDDAIMIELAVRELRHEIAAYEDFCEYRRNHPPRRGIKAKTTDLTRDHWLEKRRQALQERMRRRRKAAASRILE